MHVISKSLFLFTLIIFSCQSEKVTGRDSGLDCNGVVNGNSFEDNCGVCDDDPTNDCEKDCAEVWGGTNICGCTDSTAINYDSNATFDDGSCDSSIAVISFIKTCYQKIVVQVTLILNKQRMVDILLPVVKMIKRGL